MKREGGNAKMMARFYMTVVQAVLLYGVDSWTVTKARAVRYMTGNRIRKRVDGSWEYPNHEELERECGLFQMDTYIRGRRGTLRKYLENEGKELLEEAMDSVPPSKTPNKVLW